MKRIAFHHQKRLQLKGPTFAWTARRPPSQKESIMIFPLSFPASTTFDNSRILLQKDTLGRVSLSIYVFIGTKGALRLPTTYDIHPIPFHPSIHKASFIIWTGLGLIWVDLQWPPMTTNSYQWPPITTNDYQLLPITTNDYQWLKMTINNYQWLSMTTNDYQRPPMTTKDYQWLPMTAFRLYSGYILPTFWLHSGYIFAT